MGSAAPDDSFRVFCAREHTRLVGSLTLYTGDREVAVELAQEALARACLHWERVSAMDAPGAWAHRVGLNLANSWAGRRRAERRALGRVALRPVARPEGDGADALAVRMAVAALPRRQRMAVVLRFWADLPVGATAEAMGCAEGTVKALTAQGIARLRVTLDLDGCEETDRVV